MIRADIARGKLVKELETLRRRVAELEELQAERKRRERTLQIEGRIL
jgi:multidrug efflux pump subunit AcrA (membrane-fusion protein)